MRAGSTRWRRSGYVLRSASAVVAFWVGAVVLAIVLGAPLFTGDLRVFDFVLGPVLTLAWLLWLLLYRPVVRYDERRVLVVNVGRIHTVPWSRVVAVQQRIGLDFGLAGGGTVRAMAVPPPARAGNVVSALDRRQRRDYDFNQHAALLEAYRIAAPPSSEPVASRWDLPALAIGVVPVVVLIIGLAIPR